jgi:hypothetical protein
MAEYNAPSQEELSLRWYENIPAATVGASAVTCTLAYFQEKYLPLGSLVEHLGALGVYCGSVWADTATTRRGFEIQQEANEAGLSIPIKEHNAHFGNPTSLDEYLAATRRPTIRLLETVGVLLGATVPPLGFGLGAARYTAAANNSRKNKRSLQKLKFESCH